jgi:acetyltransferase-like isoleucine patch superfamily enzyme
MPRSRKYSHISLSVTHLYYHSCHCNSNGESPYLTDLKSTRIVQMDINFDFVEGPTMDKVYAMLETVPKHHVCLSKDTDPVDAVAIEKEYEGQQQGPLLHEGEIVPRRIQKLDVAHNKFMNNHLAISVDNCNEDKWTDRHYTVGPFHSSEFEMGRMHFLTSNARRLYTSVVQYGSERDCSPFTFNHPLYEYVLTEARVSDSFGHYFVVNKDCHIYMSSVAVIFGGQEKHVDNVLIRHQVKYKDNVYDEDEEWDWNKFPPSSGLAPFTQRSIVSYYDDHTPTIEETVRGSQLNWNGNKWHGGTTTRAKSRGWLVGKHYHRDLDTTLQQRNTRKVEVGTSLYMPGELSTVQDLKNEPLLTNMEAYMNGLFERVEEGVMYLLSDANVKKLGVDFCNGKNKEELEAACRFVFFLYRVSRLGKMVDSRMLPPLEPSNSPQWLYERFTSLGELKQDPIPSNEEVWDKGWEDFTFTTNKGFRNGRAGNKAIAEKNNILPPICAPQVMTGSLAHEANDVDEEVDGVDCEVDKEADDEEDNGDEGLGGGGGSKKDEQVEEDDDEGDDGEDNEDDDEDDEEEDDDDEEDDDGDDDDGSCSPKDKPKKGDHDKDDDGGGEQSTGTERPSQKRKNASGPKPSSNKKTKPSSNKQKKKILNPKRQVGESMTTAHQTLLCMTCKA